MRVLEDLKQSNNIALSLHEMKLSGSKNSSNWALTFSASQFKFTKPDIAIEILCIQQNWVCKGTRCQDVVRPKVFGYAKLVR